MNLSNILKGVGGGLEFTRVLGAFGVLVYIFGAHIFIAYEVWYLQHDFDIVAYCTAFPGGLAVSLGAIATAAGIKDRNVAAAVTVASTGSNPATPPAPPPVHTAAPGELPESEKLP